MAKARKNQFCYEYPRPDVTVDIVLVTRERKPRVLLIRRKHEPFAGMWALPGGFIDKDEAPQDAARRELAEETRVRVARLEQLRTFGEPGRDPRGWTISIVYVARVSAAKLSPRGGDDAVEAAWHLLERLPPLAFDHEQILAYARRHLRKKG